MSAVRDYLHGLEELAGACECYRTQRLPERDTTAAVDVVSNSASPVSML